MEVGGRIGRVRCNESGKREDEGQKREGDEGWLYDKSEIRTLRDL